MQHISPWRWTHPTTPPMTKAYFGLAHGGCTGSTSGRSSGRASFSSSASAKQQQQQEKDEALSCDVLVSYDRDANGGEGPDCPMCKVQRLHGSEDKVFVMRVSVRQRQ